MSDNNSNDNSNDHDEIEIPKPEIKNNFFHNYELKGEKLKVFTHPAPVLKKIAVPVTEFNDELKTLVHNMLYTMYTSPGIGLAAPQVGKSLRLFVIDVWYKREEVTNYEGKTEFRLSEFYPMVFINPTFHNKKGEILYEEGCLSVPGVYEEVKRSMEVTVRYQDLKGEFQEFVANELLSVCLQHENDHLDGVIFLERLSLMKRQILEKKYLKKQKVIL